MKLACLGITVFGVWHFQEEVAKLLVEHRANKQATDWRGRLPHMMVPNQRSELCALLQPDN